MEGSASAGMSRPRQVLGGTGIRMAGRPGSSRSPGRCPARAGGRRPHGPPQIPRGAADRSGPTNAPGGPQDGRRGRRRMKPADPVAAALRCARAVLAAVAGLSAQHALATMEEPMQHADPARFVVRLPAVARELGLSRRPAPDLQEGRRAATASLSARCYGVAEPSSMPGSRAARSHARSDSSPTADLAAKLASRLRRTRLVLTNRTTLPLAVL